jgi:branched-chain amino acid aminotransferase
MAFLFHAKRQRKQRAQREDLLLRRVKGLRAFAFFASLREILLGHSLFIYFQSMNYICVDGKLLPANQPVITIDNHGYRYGNGLFETIKVVNGQLCLAAFHFERFFEGLQTLQFHPPVHLDVSKLQEQILHLCKKNQCDQLARVRLSATSGHGGINDGDDTFHYYIECWSAPKSVNQLNENGLIVGVYPDARKSCDRFAHLKSANFLPYLMAARYAKANQWNDALVLNQFDRVADASIANIFIVDGNTIATPALTEGCVAGVMRRWLLEHLHALGYPVAESNLSVEDLQQADELFLSNAMGLRWVKQFNNKEYKNKKTTEIYNHVKPIWESLVLPA